MGRKCLTLVDFIGDCLEDKGRESGRQVGDR